VSCLFLIAIFQVQGVDLQRARWEEWIELGLHRAVIVEAQSALAEEPRDAEHLALAARAAAASNHLDLAERWLDSGEGPAIELERVRSHLAADRIEEALALSLAPGEPPRPRHPDRADGWMLPSRALARAGELERARAMLEEMITRFPHDDETPAAMHLLTQAAIARGDLDEARTLRARAQKSARWRGIFDARRRQALEHPEDPLPPFGLAALWLEVGEAARSRTILDELLTTSPNFARGHALRGDADRLLGDLDASLTSWSRALSIDKDLHAARLNRALIFVDRERWVDAEADLKLLVELEEARRAPLAQAHLHLATVLEALGDPEGARAARARHAKLTGAK
jgi:tetratricopeptide (TPR) repeat protein